MRVGGSKGLEAEEDRPWVSEGARFKDAGDEVRSGGGEGGRDLSAVKGS